MAEINGLLQEVEQAMTDEDGLPGRRPSRVKKTDRGADT